LIVCQAFFKKMFGFSKNLISYLNFDVFLLKKVLKYDIMNIHRIDLAQLRALNSRPRERTNKKSAASQRVRLKLYLILSSSSHTDRFEENGGQDQDHGNKSENGMRACLANLARQEAKDRCADAEEHQHAAGVEDTRHGQNINDGENCVNCDNGDSLPKLKTDGAENYIQRTAHDGEDRGNEALFSRKKHRAENDATKCGNDQLEHKVKKQKFPAVREYETDRPYSRRGKKE